MLYLIIKRDTCDFSCFLNRIKWDARAALPEGKDIQLLLNIAEL